MCPESPLESKCAAIIELCETMSLFTPTVAQSQNILFCKKSDNLDSDVVEAGEIYLHS